MVVCLPAWRDPMVLPVHQDTDLDQHPPQQNHSQDTLDQPEDFAKLLEQQSELMLVVLQANLYLGLYNLYFYHCKPTTNVKQKVKFS